MSKDYYVTASEIGEYTYCPRGWWLHFHGKLEITPQMTAGTHLHNQLGMKVVWYRRMLYAALLLLILGLVVFLITFYIVK